MAKRVSARRVAAWLSRPYNHRSSKKLLIGTSGGKAAVPFFAWIYETICLLSELLAEDGAIFIRHDQYWSHYVKVIADEVFGKENFQNDIAVKRTYKNITRQGKVSLQIATDSLFLYFKSDKSRFYDIAEKLDQERPGYWRRIDDSSGVRNPPERVIFGKTYHPPPGKHFKFGKPKIDQLCKEREDPDGQDTD